MVIEIITHKMRVNLDVNYNLSIHKKLLLCSAAKAKLRITGFSRLNISPFAFVLKFQKKLLSSIILTQPAYSIFFDYISKVDQKYLNLLNALLRINVFSGDEKMILRNIVDNLSINDVLYFKFNGLGVACNIEKEQYRVGGLETSSDSVLELRNNFEKAGMTDVFGYNGNTGPKKYIGEKDKTKRVCRFCRVNSDNGATFKKVAHAISKSMGNSKIFCNEECDECNAKFGDIIEQDFVNLHSHNRVFMGLGTNSKSPVIKTKNGSIYREKGTIIFQVFDEVENPEVMPSEVVFSSNESVIPQNIYKCLVKYFISTLPTEYLKFFASAIDWVVGDCFENDLPLVYRRAFNNFDTCQINSFIFKDIGGKKISAVVNLKLCGLDWVYEVPAFTGQEIFEGVDLHEFFSLSPLDANEFSPVDLSGSNKIKINQTYNFQNNP